MNRVNPVYLEIFKNLFSSVAEEMGAVLQRTSFSPNIKERRDFSCAIFNKEGEMIAQAAHIPVHLGSMPESVKIAVREVRLEEGDMLMLNDPYRGGTHLPDVTLIAPVYYDGELLFYVANRAHHSDVGGMSAGSMPLSTSIFQEGIIVPPVKIVKRGLLDRDVLEIFLRNTRTPEERRGDMMAQIVTNKVGAERLKDIIAREGKERVIFYAYALLEYGERLMREVIKRIPDGEYYFEDFMEDDGISARDIAVRVRLKVKEDEAIVDFSESDREVEGSVNAVRAITLSCVYYVFQCLMGNNVISNSGVYRPIKVITKKGTVVDSNFPRAVAGGNVETSQRIVDVLLGALSHALPDVIPAASQGTMNNIAIGGFDERKGKPFTYYETIGGGMGAFAGGDGESAVHSHMTNTMNTPVEVIEHEYPLRVREYSIRRGSGGRGMYKGGDGIVREIELLCDAEVSILSERRRIPPYGLFGGEPGMTGRNVLIREGKEEILPSKVNIKLQKGDILCIETPGGGGYSSLPK